MQWLGLEIESEGSFFFFFLKKELKVGRERERETRRERGQRGKVLIRGVVVGYVGCRETCERPVPQSQIIDRDGGGGDYSD